MAEARIPYRKKTMTPLGEVEDQEWIAGITLAPFGVRIGIRTDEPALMPSIRKILLPGWQCAESMEVDHLYSIYGREHGYTLIQGTEEIARDCSLAQLLHVLEQSVHIQVGAYARNHVFVHAGVVAWKGQAIMVPGRSGVGKSTLVKAMVDAGATYYSDEFAVVRVHGSVEPYPRPLALRDEKRMRPALRISPSRLGWRPGLEPLHVRAILFTRYRRNEVWDPAVISPGEAVLRLYSHTICARTNTELAFEVLTRVASEALLFEGYRGEADSVAHWVLNRLGGCP